MSDGFVRSFMSLVKNMFFSALYQCCSMIFYQAKFEGKSDEEAWSLVNEEIVRFNKDFAKGIGIKVKDDVS